MEMQRFKCHTCFLIIQEACLDDGLCPICHNKPEKMCALDRVCLCPNDFHSGIFTCVKCGKPVCPCGSHSVVQISRVTGYLADVSGFNLGKRAELRDRHRINIAVD